MLAWKEGQKTQKFYRNVAAAALQMHGVFCVRVCVCVLLFSSLHVGGNVTCHPASHHGSPQLPCHMLSRFRMPKRTKTAILGIRLPSKCRGRENTYLDTRAVVHVFEEALKCDVSDGKFMHSPAGTLWFDV